VWGTDGVERTRVYQSDNPDSVEVQPAGVYGNECLIQGTLRSISDTRVGEELYNLVLDEMGRQFSQVEGVYLGPEARRYFEAGGRLTQAAAGPPECDFRPTPEG
jgi:hypothetical protein